MCSKRASLKGNHIIGGVLLQNPSQQQPQANQQQAGLTNNNHGGHEVFDAHEAISGVISILDHYQMYGEHVQDQELQDILQRQSNFVRQTYNTIVQTFSTGQDPQTATQQYKMQQNNDVVYGLNPTQPKKPNQSVSELSDQGLSTYMLGQTKNLATLLTMTSLEMTNPILRRVIADTVPNFVEMSYELFLYQNKLGYYQVPQLQTEDMNQLLQSFSYASPQSH